MGWASLSNGELLAVIENQFDVKDKISRIYELIPK